MADAPTQEEAGSERLAGGNVADEAIGKISIDLKLNSMSDIDILTGTFKASFYVTFLWKLPHGLWPTISSVDGSGPDTGTEVANALDTIHEWPRFELRGINNYRSKDVSISLAAKKPNGDFRGLHLPLTQPLMSNEGTSGAPTPGGERDAFGLELIRQETVQLDPAPAPSAEQGLGGAPSPNERPILLPTSSETSAATDRRNSYASMANAGRRGNLRFAMRETASFGGSALMPEEEVYVKLKLEWSGAIIETEDLGHEYWDLSYTQMRHPFDMHMIVFAFDFVEPLGSQYQWPGINAGDFAFTPGFTGWPWQPNGDFRYSKFHRSVCRVFPSDVAKTHTLRHRRWQRVSQPEFQCNPTLAQKRKSLNLSGSRNPHLKKSNSNDTSRETVLSSGPVEPGCHFSFMLERNAPLLSVLNEIFRPCLLVLLGACKFKVPLNEVADRASIDFVLLLVLADYKDVGLPGVFDLMDLYVYTCTLFLWISAFSTVLVAEFPWDLTLDDDESDESQLEAGVNQEEWDRWFFWVLFYLFLIFNSLYMTVVVFFWRSKGGQINMLGVSSFDLFKSTEASNRTKISPDGTKYKPIIVRASSSTSTNASFNIKQNSNNTVFSSRQPEGVPE